MRKVSFLETLGDYVNTGHAATFAGRGLLDAIGMGRRAPNDYEVHLDAAIAWLERAHRMTGDDGVSYGCSVRGGWRESYRETSGYIAQTFFDLAQRRDYARGEVLGIRIAHWLRGVQNPDGSFSNPRYDAQQGIVFDTGQALIGLVRAYQTTQDGRFLESALRAGHWLAERVDAEGAFRRNTFLGVVHTYNTRTAWSMLMLDAVHPVPQIREAARKNIDWALTQERQGWFKQCAFKPGVPPFTHTIAYAIRGVWEAGVMLDEERFRATARRCAEAVARLVREDGYLPGRIDEQGLARANFVCLTGNCQMAIIWLKMFQKGGDPELRRVAERVLQYVMACQDVTTSNRDVFGAIKGSHPIWARYAPLSFPNWATKFFIDAMLLLQETTP